MAPQLPIEAHRHDAEIHNRGGTIGPGKELCSQPRLKVVNVGQEPWFLSCGRRRERAWRPMSHDNNLLAFTSAGPKPGDPAEPGSIPLHFVLGPTRSRR